MLESRENSCAKTVFRKLSLVTEGLWLVGFVYLCLFWFAFF